MDPITLIPYVPVEWLPVFILGVLILRGLQIWKDGKAAQKPKPDEFHRDPDVKG
jgi:hypothetical protein